MLDPNLVLSHGNINSKALKRILSPADCYNPKAIKSFLILSRKFSDHNAHVDVPRTGSCDDYIKEILFTHWLSRDYILDYCTEVADKANAQAKVAAEKTKEPNPIDPRIDPYGNRDYGYRPPSSEDAIYSWVSYEKEIEKIIKQDTVKFLLRKCGPSLLKFHSASNTRLTASNDYATLYENYKELNKDLYKDL